MNKILLPCLLLALTAAPAIAEEAHTNRLANSPNPYLLQHAHNPVDWYPWGEEALAQAKRENKPIFISVGYSTCYWCHVAEREIYSNPDIARQMNQWFVNIKIDREERPDLDRLYMLATQTLTGGGGWPNNVFLTPDLKPFFAGSYFPPTDHDGQPSFPRVLETLHTAWETDRAKVQEKADWLYGLLRDYQGETVDITSRQPAIGEWVKRAVQRAAEDTDTLQGGFKGGGTTKFPNEPKLGLLLAAYPYDNAIGKQALPVLESSLNAMASGGIMDQLGGGFHRYSTDPGWDVPHFEKMLYNNAQLLGLYARAYAITRQPLYQQVAQRTATYLTRDMQAPDGAFYSAQDAATNGVEGASYVWTQAQIRAILGDEDSQQFFSQYQIIPMPDLPAGHEQPDGGVLRLKATPADAAKIAALEPLRQRLLEARQQRQQPSRDEKIIVADNALTVIGFSQAGRALHDENLTKTATRTAEWLWKNAFDSTSGSLHHQFFRGKPGGQGFLDDYALLGQAFITLHHTSGDAHWQTRAQQVADAMLKRFAQADGRLVSSQDKTLLLETPEDGDATKPSGQAAAVALLLELAATTKTDGQQYTTAARKVVGNLYPQVNPAPQEWGTLLAALAKPHQLALLTGTATDQQATTPDPLDSAAHVKASGEWQSGQGGLPTLRVSLHIASGYHIHANPASAPDLVATQLRLAGHPDLAVDYPPGKPFKAAFARDSIAVYAGNTVLQAHLPSRDGELPAKASVEVQACNAQTCLAPATLDIPLGTAGSPAQ